MSKFKNPSFFDTVINVCEDTDKTIDNAINVLNDNRIHIEAYLKTLNESNEMDYMKKPYRAKLTKRIIRLSRMISNL